MKETHMTLIYDGNDGGCIRSKKTFDSYPPIIQLDLLTDWIADLTNLYDETLRRGLVKDRPKVTP